MLDGRIRGWLGLGLLCVGLQWGCSSACPKGAHLSASGLCMVELKPGASWRQVQPGRVKVRLGDKAVSRGGFYGVWLAEVPRELRAELGLPNQIGPWKLMIRREDQAPLPEKLAFQWKLPTPALRARQRVAVVARWMGRRGQQSKVLSGRYLQTSGFFQVKVDDLARGVRQLELIPVVEEHKPTRKVAHLQKF